MAKSSIPDAIKWAAFAIDAYKEQTDRETDDLKCQLPDGLWPDEIKKARGPAMIGGMSIPGRPMLSIATLDEPVQLILNQQRNAHLTANFHPLSEDADDDTAQVLQGLYRRGEQDSNAHLVRAWGFDHSAKVGRGWYRLKTVYDPDGGHPLDQKIVWSRILYQGTVVPDPFAQEPDWSDGLRMMILNKVSVEGHKQKWGKAKLSKYGKSDFDELLKDLGSDAGNWIQEDEKLGKMITVAEEWRVDIEQIKHVLLSDGSMVPETTKLPEGVTVLTGDEARTKYEEKRRVFWRVINCEEELEAERQWDGQYIPIIPTIGRELQPIDGKRVWVGMYRPAKDGARLTNYAASGAVEMAALEPKAPWQGEEGVFEGHEEEYRQSNIRNIPYLQHRKRGLDGTVAEAPKRVQVDSSRLGPNMALLSMGREIVQIGTSFFDPALGKQTPAHRSGRAIIASQDQTVESTSHYLQNLADISMMYEAKVWLDLAPHIYDREGRIARILDRQDKSSVVMLNQPFTPDPRTGRPQPVQLPMGANPTQVSQDQTNPVKHYDLKKARYGVSVTIGKSNGDRLQQGATEMGELMQSAPEYIPILGPEYLKFRDFPGHENAAELLKKHRDYTMPWLSDDPQNNVQGKLAQLTADNQRMQQMMAEMQQTIEADKVKSAAQIEIAHGKNITTLEKTQMDNETKLAVAELGAKIDRIALFYEERARLGVQDHEAQQDAAQHEHEETVLDREHANTMQQADQAHAQAIVQGEQAQSHGLETTAAQPPEPEPSA